MLLHSCTSCEEQCYYLIVHNNSNDTIVCTMCYERSFGTRDTMLHYDKSSYRRSLDISPHYYLSCLCWGSKLIPDERDDFDTMSIFFIKYYTYGHSSWDSIVSNYDIIYRYDIPSSIMYDGMEYNQIRHLNYPPDSTTVGIITYSKENGIH